MWAIHQDPFTSSASQNAVRKRVAARKARIVGRPLMVAESIANTGDLVVASMRFTSRLDVR